MTADLGGAGRIALKSTSPLDDRNFMSTRFIPLLALVAMLAVAGCGGSSSDTSSKSSNAGSDQAQSTTPAASQSASAAKKQASAATSSTGTGGATVAGLSVHSKLYKKLAKKTSPNDHRTVAQRVKTRLHARTLMKQALVQTKKQRSLQAKEANKIGAKQEKDNAKARAQAKKAAAALNALKSSSKAKTGASGIPAAIAAACNKQLRSVDGALASNTKAAALPTALTRTLSELASLSAKGSSAASNTTGDVAGRLRAQWVMGAIRPAVAKAKVYAANHSSSAKTAL